MEAEGRVVAVAPGALREAVKEPTALPVGWPGDGVGGSEARGVGVPAKVRLNAPVPLTTALVPVPKLDALARPPLPLALSECALEPLGLLENSTENVASAVAEKVPQPLGAKVNEAAAEPDAPPTVAEAAGVPEANDGEGVAAAVGSAVAQAEAVPPSRMDGEVVALLQQLGEGAVLLL